MRGGSVVTGVLCHSADTVTGIRVTSFAGDSTPLTMP